MGDFRGLTFCGCWQVARDLIGYVLACNEQNEFSDAVLHTNTGIIGCFSVSRQRAFHDL